MGSLYLIWILLAILILLRKQQSRSIPMSSEKFWALVKSQDKPVVLLTTRGVFGRQLCYAFPYQGVIFRTDAKQPEAPPGVRLVGTGPSFGL